MGKILCAIRGGEEGYRTQDAAITLARERGDDLCFLCILDLSFMGRWGGPDTPDTRGALAQVGQFLLTRAAERARQAGIEARMLLREGQLREQIKAAAREEGVTTVILGRPQGRYDMFASADLEEFARQIQSEIGIEIRIE